MDEMGIFIALYNFISNRKRRGNWSVREAFDHS